MLNLQSNGPPTMHYMKLPFETSTAKHAIVFVGIPASGKTTFFKEYLLPLGYEHINLDTLRTRHREALLLEECFESGKSFVVDNTNVSYDLRGRYVRMAHDAGYHVTCIFFQSRIKDCLARNNARGGNVPDCAVANMSRNLQLPKADEGFDELFFARITQGGYEITDYKL